MKNYDKSEVLEHSDAEITLGMRSILGIFFALVLICGVFFGFGYSVGRGNAAKAVASVQAAPPSSTPASPSLVKTVVEQPASPGADVSDSDPYAGSTASSTKRSGAGAALQSKPSPAASASPQAADIAKPAPGNANAPAGAQPTQASYNIPASAKAPAGAIMVQIAAVSHQQDADVLVSALQKFGYSASVHSESTDNLLHVQIGPFATRDQAIAMRAKLLNDGYNAILK